jgi:hypothetical protein
MEYRLERRSAEWQGQALQLDDYGGFIDRRDGTKPVEGRAVCGLALISGRVVDAQDLAVDRADFIPKFFIIIRATSLLPVAFMVPRRQFERVRGHFRDAPRH